MNEQERILILGGVLKRIGNFLPESFEKAFDSRLIFQKTIYLLQAFGLHFGYRFSWYVSGPYSTNLTRDGYELIGSFKEAPNVTFTKASSEEKFNDFLSFLGDRKNDANWLETLASIHFLRRVYPKKGRMEILGMILEKQPHLTAEEFNEALLHLEEFGLLG